MRIDKPEHQKNLLRLLKMPGLVISPQKDQSLADAAREYLEVLSAVESATVGEAEFARVLAVPESPED